LRQDNFQYHKDGALSSLFQKIKKGSRDGVKKKSRDGAVVIALVSHLRGLGSGHEWVKLVVGSLLCSKRFFSGFSSFPLSSKINISKFQFDRMQDLLENHFRVSGASW